MVKMLNYTVTVGDFGVDDYNDDDNDNDDDIYLFLLYLFIYLVTHGTTQWHRESFSKAPFSSKCKQKYTFTNKNSFVRLAQYIKYTLAIFQHFIYILFI